MRWTPTLFRKLLLVLLLGAPCARAQALLQGRTLSGGSGSAAWSRQYPAELGALSGPLRQDGLTWLAVGPALFAYGDGGEQRARLDFPAEISALDAGGGLLQVTAGLGSVRQTFTVDGLELQGRVVLPPDPWVTGWLRRAAGLVPQGRLEAGSRSDPANPFLWLRLARLWQRQGDRVSAVAAAERAASATAPFAALVGLAAGLDEAGFPAAADLALDRAARDWAARGYDPALPVSREALRAYGDPLGELDSLLAGNRLRRADAWIRYLRVVSPRFEGAPAVYARYASVLDAQDRGGEADEWRQFARDLYAGTLYNLGPDALVTLGGAARLAALALALAVLAALLSLTAHYWRVQGRDLAPLGGRLGGWLRHPLSRLRRVTLSYARLGEKLVLAALLGGLLLALSGWAWTERVGPRLHDPGLGLGTLGGAWFYDRLDRLDLQGAPQDAALIRGLAAQLDGDGPSARRLYAAAPGSACVLNNLGVLAAASGDSVQARSGYREALAADPTLPAAAYNLGLRGGDPGTDFQAKYRQAPRLCYPDQGVMIRALDLAPGRSALSLLGAPWQGLTRLPTGLPQPLQWFWAGLLLVLGASSLLWLVVPRLPSASGAGRPALYRLLALLLPGAALLDGAWGSVLLLGWAGVGVGLLGGVGLFPAGTLFARPDVRGLLLLGLVVCYLLNLLAFVLAEVGEARRLRRTSRR